MALRPCRQGGRRRRRGRYPRHRAGDGDRLPPHPRAKRHARQSDFHRRGRVHRHRYGMRPPQRDGGGEGVHAPQVARPQRETVPREAFSHAAHDHGPARHRYPLSHRPRRRGGGPGALRQRQDGRPAPARQVGGGGYHRLRRLRRTRQRDDGRPQRIPRTQRPQDGRTADEAHRAHRKHLRYARGGARGVHLYGHHHCRIFPRHGL